MPNQSLALAYAIRRKQSQKLGKTSYPVKKDENYAHGGQVEEEPLDLSPDPNPKPKDMPDSDGYISPDSIVKSVRAKQMAAGGEVDDDFLSAEENTELPDESEPEELPDMKRKRMLSKAFEMVRQRQTRIQK